MPFELENGTDYIGLEIADQLWLENDATSGGIKWPRCCCQAPTPDCGNCCNPCYPHNIPREDLLLTYTTPDTGFPCIASGTVILYYNPTLPDWSGFCSILYGEIEYNVGFWFECVSGQVCLAADYKFAPDVPLKADAFAAGNCCCSCCNCSNPAWGPVLISSNTNPFGLHYQFLSSPPFSQCFLENSWCINDITITADSYGITTCCQRFHVECCNSLSLSGATVSVYDTNGGTLLAQGITPVNGTISLLWSGSGNAYVTVTATRFTSYGQSLSLTQNGTTTITLSESSGYHCISTCPIPMADTLNATFSVAGAQTFTFSGTAWTSSFTASGHAYVASIGQNGARTITRDGTSCGTIGGGISSCPMSFAASMVPPSGNCLTEIGTATLTE